MERVAEVYVKQVTGTSREYEAARSVHNDMELLLECRFKAGITEDMFVWYAGRRFDIKGVYDPDGKRRRTHIACVSKRK